MLNRLVSVRLGPVQMTWAVALFFTTVGNFTLWQHLWSLVRVDDLHGALFFASLPVFFFCVFNILLSPFGALPYVRKPFFAVLILISAGCTYFMWHYNVLIDRSMVQNFFETNKAEFDSYVSWSLFCTVGLLGIVPVAWMSLVRIHADGGFLHNSVWWVGNVVLSMVLFAVVAFGFYKDYASLFRNNKTVVHQILPVNFIRSTSSYLKRKYSVASTPLVKVALDATRPAAVAAGRPKLLVLVVGETARAKNFQLNGYAQHRTNPRLAQRQDLVVFRNVSSCGTATAISLPCMFSRMPRTEFNEVRAATEENLLDILQRTGVHVLWRNNNNGGCKGVCERVPTDDMPAMKVHEYCVNKDGTCYDGVLLYQLRARIDALKGDAVIVLHQLGSHGPTYFERYPKEDQVFMPTCDSNQIQNCATEQLVNTYDNTIVYTDKMLDETITLLQGYAKSRDVGMIYLSDHGESLGEKGMYLHGTPYFMAPQEQTGIPMLMWFSPSFIQNAAWNTTCLHTHASDEVYSQDNLFHSVLGLFDVQTAEYQKNLDIFFACKKPRTQFDASLKTLQAADNRAQSLTH